MDFVGICFGQMDFLEARLNEILSARTQRLDFDALCFFFFVCVVFDCV